MIRKGYEHTLEEVYTQEGLNYPELERMCLLVTESGFETTGWYRRVSSDDLYFCFGCKSGDWVYEFEVHEGSVLRWAYI